MGHVTAKVRLCNPRDVDKSVDLELLVDTGSTYTWVKRARLEGLGLKPTARRTFRTVEGKLIEREVGEAVVECMGEGATTIIVFAEEGDVEVLGVHALEDLGLEVDPAARELRRSEAILAI